MASGLKGLLSQAQRLARKRGQALTTHHVLLALYQRSSIGDVLGAFGISESALIAALPNAGDEHPNVLALVVERAEKAAASEHGRPSAEQLLLALTREPRAAAYRCLERLGAQPLHVQHALLDAADAHAQPPESKRARTASAEPALSSVRGGASHGRTRRVALSISAQQRLAVETESKRARDRARRKPGEAYADFEAPPRTRSAIPEGVSAGAVPLDDAARRSPDAPPNTQRETRPSTQRETQRTLPTSRASTPAVSAPVATSAAIAARKQPAPPAPGFTLDPERFPLLASLGRDLCQSARDGRIDPVLGRELEIEQMLDVLTRRRANNPILVGPPGVGKTAIVEGVALALVSGAARGLEGRALIELSAAALVSGTGVRGALSERLQTLTQEIASAQGRVIVFIDEIHCVVGSDEGADSLGQGLKTALARGELPCIGATTEAEYRRVFERDAALARRFTRIDVGEPTKTVALEILRGLAPAYEKHHGVAYEPAALEAAIEMSVRFLPERHLPDKAVALIDQAGARVRRRGANVAGVAAVAEVVAELSAVPLERLLMRDGDALLALDAHLERRVVGQPAAISALSDALRKSAAGFRGNRPLGTFLFLGPTGVGKTEMAKAIAELMFPGREPTRIDMSELSEPHTVARLLGSPPGYIGHEEGGQLTEAVRARPYSLVLLDEVEKAHRDVLLALLPALDEGRLQDARGRTIDFRNTVIVMTSNLGAEAIEPRARVGFGAVRESQANAVEQRVLHAARYALPPELWNRIDEPLYFRPLERDSVVRIAGRMIDGVAALVLREHGITLEIEPSAIDALINSGGYDPELGARPMRRTVGRLLEAPLARAILAGQIVGGDRVLARGWGDHITFEKRGAHCAAAAIA